jgi:protein-S-isoprenylcysteine O-methyltransferase Ste14
MSNHTQKHSLMATSGFFALIAFEFIYMATPFAAFFYSVSSPILNLLNRYESLAWLNGTFLPHIVQDTKSPILNILRESGIIFTAIGLTGFLIGAIQIYHSKLFRKQMVIKGLYMYIRHPQYTFLVLSGMGLVILWPRTIVLLSFITMLFLYYFLARIEESECESKYGTEFTKYKQATGMFFPIFFRSKESTRFYQFQGIRRCALILSVYLFTLMLTLGSSIILRHWVSDNLYAVYTRNIAYISITKMEEQSLARIIHCASSNPEVLRRLDQHCNSSNKKLINYILPSDMYMLEIPMNEVPESNGYHFLARNHSIGTFKIIFTKAETRIEDDMDGKELLFQTIKRIPLLEVTIEPTLGKVIAIKDPPAQLHLAEIAMPIF